LTLSFKPLFKYLIEKDLKKKDLYAVVSPASITKMGRGGHVTTETIEKICVFLNCGISDVLEIIPDPKE
jgi:DNA-binding Xre family transcriptional regulator